MPHRAGYFVLAYQWDHHCNDLLNSIRDRLHNIITRLVELERAKPVSPNEILEYYTVWSSCNEEFSAIIESINKKQETIHALGYRGYGVNRDLLKALEDIKNEYESNIRRILKRRFEKYLDKAVRYCIAAKNQSNAITPAALIYALRPKSEKTDLKNSAFLKKYFRIKKETAASTNQKIFEKLFLASGSESVTIMKGSMGHQNLMSEKTLKLIGNRNLLELCRNSFSKPDDFKETGLDLLKKIHYMISVDIDPHAGDFRQHDFEDKNGVTLEFGNFEREIKHLDETLGKASKKTNSLEAFISSLALAYYMFLGIHPFIDSNGRVGRCFINYMLLKKGLPPAIFGDRSEILALPRYGGTVEDMRLYLNRSIRKAIEAYFYERSKLERLGLLNRPISNVSFDSGFSFRIFKDRPDFIEINFPVFIIAKNNPLHKQYKEQCRIVFEDEADIKKIVLHYGFSEHRLGEWKNIYDSNKPAFKDEIKSSVHSIRIFDAVFFVKPVKNTSRLYNYFNCCVSSGNSGMFNNKGLNYSFKLRD
ncbi:MAG: Fic family protein [Nitrospirae bacterium]|nr:Fic family protein [Nitrospirota bacterium]